jgi:hypothetical protein
LLATFLRYSLMGADAALGVPWLLEWVSVRDLAEV